MKLEVTRDVVHDLWPLCQSGDATDDSRRLVDAYLSADPEFATSLKEIAAMNSHMHGVTLSPDAERQLLDDARQRARTKLLVIGGGVAAAAVILLVALFGILVLFLRSS